MQAVVAQVQGAQLLALEQLRRERLDLTVTRREIRVRMNVEIGEMFILSVFDFIKYNLIVFVHRLCIL